MVYDKGDDSVLACTHQGGPGNTVQWLRDGEVLENETNTTLTLTSVSIGEIYTCFVSNLAGEGYADVTLNIAPVITAQPNNTYTFVNETVVLCCCADAYPAPDYTWVKVNGSLPVSAVSTDMKCLQINVTFGDKGEYVCMATSNNITATSHPTILTSECLCFPDHYILPSYHSITYKYTHIHTHSFTLRRCQSVTS